MKRLTWHLVKKTQGHVTHTKNDHVFGRQRKKQEGQRHQYEVMLEWNGPVLVWTNCNLPHCVTSRDLLCAVAGSHRTSSSVPATLTSHPSTPAVPSHRRSVHQQPSQSLPRLKNQRPRRRHWVPRYVDRMMTISTLLRSDGAPVDLSESRWTANVHRLQKTGRLGTRCPEVFGTQRVDEPRADRECVTVNLHYRPVTTHNTRTV